MSRSYAVLTAIGKDKPGLVDAISSYILQCGCNIEDSRMAMLGGEFAMLILVDGEAEAVGKLTQSSAEEGGKVGLSIQVRPTDKPGEGAGSGTIPFKLDAYSLDHPGIVQRVAHFLAERRVNIRAMDTRLSYAPHTGQPLFSLHAILDVPSKENLKDLRMSLSTIGAEENIDIEIKPAQ
jgi:glycine cleavage system transcriptional repressor